MRNRKCIANFLFCALFLMAGQLPAEPLQLILDMVHHNPGEAKYVSHYNDPATTKALGYNGKVYFLFESAHLAIDWSTYDKDLFPSGSIERKWIDAKFKEVTGLYDKAKSEGLLVLCQSDLLLFPIKLISKYNMSSSFKDPNNSKTKEMLQVLLKEMFKDFPQLDGIVVRIGETYMQDAPYHQGGINDKSSPSKTIIPLMNILREEVCVKLNKYVIFRSWLSFDVNSNDYKAVSDAVSPHEKLFIGVKHCEGDFHRGNCFSKVIGTGQHKQIIEIQCAREYEGKGAYPNYIAKGVIDGFDEYKYTMKSSDIQSLRKAVTSTSLIGGVWTWSRGGGWQGPFITNEMWCDLNVYVVSKWAQDPSLKEEDIFNQYATTVLKLSDTDAVKFRTLCLKSTDAVIRGKRTTHNDHSPWWSRDHWISAPPLPSGSEQRKRTLAQKLEAEKMWEEIIQIAKSITFADAATTDYTLVSSLYGHFTYRIYRIAFDLADLKSNISGNKSKITQLLHDYDKTWSQYRALKNQNPSCASIYTDLSFSNETKGSLKEFIESLKKSVGYVSSSINDPPYHAGKRSIMKGPFQIYNLRGELIKSDMSELRPKANQPLLKKYPSGVYIARPCKKHGADVIKVDVHY